MSKAPHISRWNLFKRNIYIKKRFQTDFSIKFLILIAIESVVAIALFIYMSRGTVITGYSNYELVIAKTGDYFLPTLVIINLAVIGVTAAAGFIFMLLESHKIAGPLYRFEKSLEETGGGNLTNRFNLRTTDQMHFLAQKVNEFNSKMDASMSEVQKGLAELDAMIEDIKSAAGAGDDAQRDALVEKAHDRLAELKRAANYFKTSGGNR